VEFLDSAKPQGHFPEKATFVRIPAAPTTKEQKQE
jgi:hypothetical protein